MHNTVGRAAAQLSVFSGLISLAESRNLPKGGSPRNQNCDFDVGSVFTRGPLVNPFTYANNDAGPSPGNAAADVSLASNPWSSVSNVLGHSGYAQSSLTAMALGVAVVQVLSVGGIWYSIVSFGQNVPAWAPLQQYVFSGLTHYTALNGDVLTAVNPVSIGLSLAANQAVFRFGSAAYGPTPDTGTASVPGYVLGTDAIQITEFAFSITSGTTPQGFIVATTGYAPNGGATLYAQLLKAGIPVGSRVSIALPTAAGNVSLGGINNLFGASWIYSDLNNTTFGVRLWAEGTAAGSVYLGYTTITAYFLPTQENFNYVTTFEDDFGNISTLAIDNSGQWWVEDVLTAPGVLSPLFGGPPSGSFASSFTADSRQYWCTSNLLQGNYPPQQYTGQWNDRVSQVGPGAAPTFSGVSSSGSTFDITSITQLAAHTQGYSYFLQSAGPGNTSPGNVVTIYYLDSTVAPGPDPDLVAAFNSGYPVYLWCSFTAGGGGIGNPNLTAQVVGPITAINKGQPPGQPRAYYYFTFEIAGAAAYNFTDESSSSNSVTYQQTLATMTMAESVPGLAIGNKVTIAGATPTGWNNQWTITETPNSGTYSVTETGVASGVATWTYTLIAGAAPSVGQSVIVGGTNGDSGQLNGTFVISAVGTNTFSANVSLPDKTTGSDPGQATSAGTIFNFDPGAQEGSGSAVNPIVGNTTAGGALTFAGTGQYVSPGTRKGTVFFITRNGYWTAPAPPVTFSLSGNTITGIQANNLPIGPPNVIARGVVFTEAGANGVPGANFYTIPAPVQYVVDDVTYTADALFVNDNTTTSATFFFSDAVLLTATEVDIQGNDLFALGELGDSAWCTQYVNRTVWGRVNNKLQNLVNPTFDGGYLANPGGNLLPLGWSVDTSTIVAGSEPTLLVSPVFGNSYYLSNQSGSTQAAFGRIYQSAYQDWEQVAILQNQTAYSVRVTCRTPSSATVGSLVIDLASWDSGTGFGATYGTYTLPLASMTSAMATYTGALLLSNTLNIPPDLQLRVWAENLGNRADLEIDRIEIFPTIAPINLTGLTFSYQNDLESCDLVTGGNDTAALNAQPANGAFVMHGTLYVVKEASLGFFKDTPNQEPANWQPFEEVSNVAGAAGINAFDVGEEWAVMACQNGLFLFDGGQPWPIQLEIPDLWAAINWDAGHTICVRNDVPNRRILCAIPLPTPNPWMIDAEVNSAPTAPNVILALNYKGIGAVQELMRASPIYTTMMGKLAVHDIRRKWSIWTIPAPYLGWVKRGELSSEMMFCNGVGSSKIYALGATPTGYDDGAPFVSSYCTYGFVDPDEAEMNPIFGQFNKRFNYWDILVQGSGTAAVTFWQNDPVNAPYPFTVPGGVTLSPTAPNDYEGPLNVYCQRLFVEIVMNEGWFDLSRVTVAGAKDRWAPNRGIAR